MGKATIVSIVPFPISEFKPGIYPGKFDIPASDGIIPQLFVVGDSVYHVELDLDRTITVTAQAEQIAKSLVDDYIVSNLGYDEEANAAPGFFWLPGEVDLTLLTTKYSKQFEEAKGQQHRWFVELIRLADDDWEKTRQHKAISDIQRHAAKALNQDRPWIIAIPDAKNSIKCPACQLVIDAKAIVCHNCKCIIDMAAWEKHQFASVK